MPAKSVHTVKNLYVLQSRYAKNGFQGNSRWVLVEPEMKTMKGAIGKDGFPPAFAVLRDASGSGGLPDSGELASLRNAGILTDAPAGQNASRFFQLYHEYVRNYPFNDYSRPRRWNKDREQMAEYGKIQMPPSQYSMPTDYFGPKHRIPIPAFRDLSESNRGDAIPVLSVLATAAAGSFQATGSINGGDFGPWLRKACPSGGARHPTELRIQFYNVPGCPDGDWLYDASRHELVDQRLNCAATEDQEPTITLRFVTRVERPMWRYREARSLRPVIIDAGHVIENVGAYLKSMGFQLAVDDTDVSGAEFDFDAPALASYRLIGPGLSTNPLRPVPTPEVSEDECGIVQANPFLWLQITDGKILASVSYPAFAKVEINETEFKVLNYAIPSKRGDRDSSKQHLAHLFTDGDLNPIESLIGHGFLISQANSKILDRKVQPWCQFGWYQSLLAYADLSTSTEPFRPTLPNAGTAEWRNIHDLRDVTSAKRKTTRNFQKTPLHWDWIQDLARLINANPAMADGQLSGRLCDFDGEKGQLYAISDLTRHDNPSASIGMITRDQVSRNSIGQYPINRAACVLWLYYEARPDDPRRYAARLIDFGQVGQQICLHAAASNVGVFLTPAVCDTNTQSMLRLPDRDDPIFYLFAFGQPVKENTLSWQEGGTSPFENLVRNGAHFFGDPVHPGTGLVVGAGGQVTRGLTET